MPVAKTKPKEAGQKGAKTKSEQTKRAIGEAISTPIFRAAFCWVHQPDSGREYSDDKYKLTALISKEREGELKELKLAILKTAREEWGPNVKYAELEVPFKDGDDKAERLESHGGQIYFQMKSFRKPGIVGPSLEALDNPEEEFYAGCWARAKVRPKAYERTATEVVGGKRKSVVLKGVSLMLQSLQKAKDDAPFGAGGGDPSKDFEELMLDELNIGPEALDDPEEASVGEEEVAEDEII